MAPDYLIVANAILPEEYEKVIEARELLQSKEAATVTEAVKRCGISRNTYYKYKDYNHNYNNKEEIFFQEKF